MRASELRPCDVCGESLGTAFHVVKHSLHVIDQAGARDAIRESVFLPGPMSALGTNPVVAHAVADQPGQSWDHLIVCTLCMASTFGELAAALEHRSQEQSP